MTSIGMLLTVLAIGLVIFVILRTPGGGCCGHADDRDHGHDQAGQPGSEPKQHRGGCCG